MSGVDEFLAELAPSAYGWPESLRFTYDRTRWLLEQGVPGDLVECGVGAGVHPAVMARACEDAGEQRIIRLFDSFEGIPHGGEHDVEWNKHWGDGSGRLESSGVTAHSQADVLANLKRWTPYTTLFNPYRFHPGWFQDTVPAIAATSDPGSIALLRLDGDLYESTTNCLMYFYPLVSSGGIVVLDDWNLDGCRRAFFEYFDGQRELPPAVIEITRSGDVWWRKQ